MNNQTQQDLAEQSVIGSLLLDSSRLSEIDLKATHFHSEPYSQVFQAIEALVLRNEPVDIITVSECLDRTTGKNWLPLVGHLANNTPTAANVAAYAKNVKRQATQRQAVNIANSLINNIGTQGQGSVDAAIRDLMAININRKDYEFSAVQAASEAMKGVDAAYQAGGKLTGVKTGLSDLNEKMGGLHNSDLIVVGARPAMGKTAFMINLANSADVPCGIISGEQGHEQMGLRLVSVSGKVNAHSLRLARLNDDDWRRTTQALAHLKDKSIWIYDKPGPTINDVVRQARKWKHERNIKILYVDYIQRIKAKAPTRREEVAAVCMALKELARELDIPVVALAQVSRKVEERVNKRPLLSDLKEAGEIEQEADIIMTLYRDEVYDIESPAKGIAEIGIIKNRHGPTGIISCSWVDKFMIFEDISTPQYWSN